MREIREARDDMEPLFEAIIEHIPRRRISRSTFRDARLQPRFSDYLGRIAYGKITSGKSRLATRSSASTRTDARERASVHDATRPRGPGRDRNQRASAGDIVGLAGFEDVFIGETLTDPKSARRCPSSTSIRPRSRCSSVVNDSPLAGKEGKLLHRAPHSDRLVRETRTNVSIHVADTDTAGVFRCARRGEMQIAILRRTDAPRRLRGHGFAPGSSSRRNAKVSSSRSRRSTSKSLTTSSATFCNRWQRARRI